MKNRIAVVLVGTQNSGKTTTIKHFDSMYDEWGRTKKQCKAGWRYLRLHKSILNDLITQVFFIPASPTETGVSVEKRLKGKCPDFLLIAEQIDKGEKHNRYKETIDFLRNEGYEIIEILIGDDGTNPVWQKWDNERFAETMAIRGREIGDLFREFIKRRMR